MSEETKKAKSAVPRAMFWSIVMNGVLAFIMVIMILLSMGSVEDTLGAAHPVIAVLCTKFFACHVLFRASNALKTRRSYSRRRLLLTNFCPLSERHWFYASDHSHGILLVHHQLQLQPCKHCFRLSSDVGVGTGWRSAIILRICEYVPILPANTPEQPRKAHVLTMSACRSIPSTESQCEPSCSPYFLLVLSTSSASDPRHTSPSAPSPLCLH